MWIPVSVLSVHAKVYAGQIQGSTDIKKVQETLS